MTLVYNGQTRSSLHVKCRKFFISFLQVLAEFRFWEGDWRLGYKYVKF